VPPPHFQTEISDAPNPGSQCLATAGAGKPSVLPSLGLVQRAGDQWHTNNSPQVATDSYNRSSVPPHLLPGTTRPPPLGPQHQRFAPRWRSPSGASGCCAGRGGGFSPKGD
jgi:hypothetical protein